MHPVGESRKREALSSPGTRVHACRECHTGAQMAGAENSTLTPRDEDEGLGAGFFLKIAGLVLAGGIIAMIVCLIWWRAVYAWGFLGGFLAFAAVLCLFAWLYDRRNPHTT